MRTSPATRPRRMAPMSRRFKSPPTVARLASPAIPLRRASPPTAPISSCAPAGRNSKQPMREAITTCSASRATVRSSREGAWASSKEPLRPTMRRSPPTDCTRTRGDTPTSSVIVSIVPALPLSAFQGAHCFLRCDLARGQLVEYAVPLFVQYGRLGSHHEPHLADDLGQPCPQRRV